MIGNTNHLKFGGKMYIILVYDAQPKRGAKLLKYLRTQLQWVQNSVFEGEITNGELALIKSEVKKIVSKKEDSVIIYTFDSMKYNEREIIGIEKNGLNFFL